MSTDIAERPANPFAAANVAARPQQHAGGALVAVESQRVMAEVQAQMMMARANPRDPIVATDRILNACTRPGLAEAAVYQYSRGGSDVSGPSIRLAEAIAQAWGNIKTSVRELEQRDGWSTVQVIAWDLETGYSSDKVFQVQHVRHTRQGTKRLEDPRDIYENTANNAARRLRACILAVIPGDVTEAAVAQCEATMKARADTSPEAVHKMVEAFKPFGVTREQIEKRIQRRLDAIQPAQVVALKKVYASLRDGMSTPADWFDASEPAADGAAPQSAADKAKEAIKQRTAAARKTAAPAVDPDIGEIGAGTADSTSAQPAFDYAAAAKKVKACADAEVLSLMADEWRDLPDGEAKDDLMTLVAGRMRELEG